MKNKRVKWLLIICGCFAFSSLALMIAGDIIHNKLEKKMSDMHLGEYRLTSGRARYNFFNRTLTLRDLTLRTEPQHHWDDSLKVPIEYVDAVIEKVKLRGVDVMAFRRNEIVFGSLQVYSPDFTLVTLRREKDALEIVQQADDQLEARKKQRMNRIAIEKMEIINGSVYWQQLGKNDTLTYQLSGWNTLFEGMSLDSARTDRQKFLFSERVSGTIGAFRHTYANRAYILGVDSLAWDSRAGNISVKDFRLMPQLSKRDFPRKTAKQSDFTDANVKGLSCMGVDFNRFWQEKRIFIDSIYMRSGYLLSNKDRNAVVPKREKSMLHSKLQEIRVPFSVRTLHAEEVDITYEEVAKYAFHPGILTFNHIRAAITGLSNIAERKDQYIEINATSQVNGAGDLTATILLPVEKGNDRFEAHAVLQSTPLTVLNRMLTPLVRVEVKSGEADRLDFCMKGNQSKAEVDMTFRYHDLEVALMKGNRERKGLSNVINIAVIEKENPDENGLRTVHTEVERDPYKSVFNYLWKGVSSGMVRTVESETVKMLTSK